MKRVLTYGTFDLLHWGHIRLLKRAKSLGHYLVVGLSTDDFNELKPGKQPSYHTYEVRKMMLESIRYVDLVIPESSWDQKRRDVADNAIDLVVMGSDWEGSPRFEHLRDLCQVMYLPRTEGTSTSQIRRDLLFEAIQYTKEPDAEHTPDDDGATGRDGAGDRADGAPPTIRFPAVNPQQPTSLPRPPSAQDG